MKNEEKESVLRLLGEKRDRLGLSNAACSRQIGISQGTMSQIVNRNWELISTEMWRKVAHWAGYAPHWQPAETVNFTRIVAAAKRAKRMSDTLCVTQEPGSGKTFALQHAAGHLAGAVYVECKGYSTPREFTKRLMAAMGMEAHGPLAERMDEIANALLRMDRPLVILDEFGELKDDTLRLFKSLYNDTCGYCGFVIAGSPSMKSRIERGVERDTRGYRELWSRMGREYVMLEKIGKKEVAEICRANGVEPPEAIERIVAESYDRKTGTHDLRRTYRLVQNLRAVQMAATLQAA
jgi:DNA transposition AAA+ family ATPase